jgi:hypothetical protein
MSGGDCVSGWPTRWLRSGLGVCWVDISRDDFGGHIKEGEKCALDRSLRSVIADIACAVVESRTIALDLVGSRKVMMGLPGVGERKEGSTTSVEGRRKEERYCRLLLRPRLRRPHTRWRQSCAFAYQVERRGKLDRIPNGK